jgi:hypothetical protein
VPEYTPDELKPGLDKAISILLLKKDDSYNPEGVYDAVKILRSYLAELYSGR